MPWKHQVLPPGDWTYWLLLAGRGSGKTDAGAHNVNRHAMGTPCLDGPVPHRIAVAAPTLGDARKTCVRGEAGIIRHNPDVTFRYTDGELFWPNGAQGAIFGAYTPEDVERWRGPEHCYIWADELAAWRYLAECWEMMDFGFRLGPDPRMVLTTTGKPRPLIKALLDDPATVVTRAGTKDNPHLAERVRSRLYGKYAGTRLERQELQGGIVEDAEGALWSMDNLERHRAHVPPMRRIVIAVDPAITKTERSDETGIIAVGLGVDGEGYVLGDYSFKGHPAEWARVAVQAYHDRKADRIVAEANQGGEMVEHTIRTVDPNVPITLVHASRGKRIRAEPIAALYEQGRVHHARGAELSALEDQMCSWSAGDGEDSPDRIDALVWGLTELMLQSAWGSGQASAIA